MTLPESLNQMERNLQGHFTWLPRQVGFPVHEKHPVAWIRCGLRSSMFNVFWGSVPVFSQEALEAVVDLFQGEPFAWWVPPSGAGAFSPDQAVAAGFCAPSTETLMVCDLGRFDGSAAQTDTLNILQVGNLTHMEHFVSVLEEADPAVRAFYESVPASLVQGPVLLFAGYHQGFPVVTGSLFLDEGIASFWNLWTQPEHRGQRYATHMMAAMMHVARSRGARTGILVASPPSGHTPEHDLYTRLGFTPAGLVLGLEHPGRSARSVAG